MVPVIDTNNSILSPLAVDKRIAGSRGLIRLSPMGVTAPKAVGFLFYFKFQLFSDDIKIVGGWLSSSSIAGRRPSALLAETVHVRPIRHTEHKNDPLLQQTESKTHEQTLPVRP